MADAQMVIKHVRDTHKVGDMMDVKLTALLYAVREAAAVLLAAVEDYLEVSNDKSLLARRRAKVRE
jgi:hypothetical protein